MQEAGALAAGKQPFCALLSQSRACNMSARGRRCMSCARQKMLRSPWGRCAMGKSWGRSAYSPRLGEAGLFDLAAWTRALVTFSQAKLPDACPKSLGAQAAEGWEMSLHQLHLAECLGVLVKVSPSAVRCAGRGEVRAALLSCGKGLQWATAIQLLHAVRSCRVSGASKCH